MIGYLAFVNVYFFDSTISFFFCLVLLNFGIKQNANVTVYCLPGSLERAEVVKHKSMQTFQKGGQC